MIKGRGNFGVIRPIGDAYAPMAGNWNRPQALDLSAFFQSRQDNESNVPAIGSAIAGAMGQLGAAWKNRPKKTNKTWTSVVDENGSGIPTYSRGGMLQDGPNIVGGELVIKKGDKVIAVPKSVTGDLPEDASGPSIMRGDGSDALGKNDWLTRITQDGLPPTHPNDVMPQRTEMPPPDNVDPSQPRPPMAGNVPLTPPSASPYNASDDPNFTDPYAAVTEPPAPTVSGRTWQQIQRREGKQFDRQPVLDAEGNQVIGIDGKPMWRPGKDNAKTHNWKDVLKSIALGALSSARMVGGNDNATSAIGKLLGGALGGGIATTFDRNADEKIGNDMALDKMYGDYGRQYGAERQRASDEAMNAQRQAAAQWNNARPDIERSKLQIAQEKIQSAMDRLMVQGQLKANQGKIQTDDEGFVVMVFPNLGPDGKPRPAIKVLDENNEPIFIPGDQSVQFKDPYSGQMITLKGKQAAQAGITQSRNADLNANAQQRLLLDQQKFQQAQQHFEFVQQQYKDALVRKDKEAISKWQEASRKLMLETAKALQAEEITKEQYDLLMGTIHQ